MDEGLERKKNRDCVCPAGYAPMDWAGKQFGNLTVAAYDGRRGVYFNRRSGRWVAQITFQGHPQNLSKAGIIPLQPEM